MVDKGILILLEYITLPILTILAIIGLSIYFIVKGDYRRFRIILAIIGVMFIVLCILPIPPKWLYTDYNEELSKSDVIVNGTWTTVYKTPDGKCLKQVSAPGVSHTDFNHVSLPTPFRYCTRESGNLITMLAHRISTRFMMLSVHRIKDMNSEFFPKIYDIDDKKRRYIQDYVPNELNPNTCPENYKQQIQAISDELEEHGYYVDDIHSKNWMVDNKGRLQIIDGELFTDNELYVQQFILNLIDGSQDGNAVPHTDGYRILHWNDGRPNIYGVCK